MRTSHLRSLFLILAAFTMVSCTSSSDSPADGGSTGDATTQDAGSADAGETDAGETDAGETDAGETDAGTPSCDDLVCETNEVCSEAGGTPACVCESGYQDHDEDGTCTPDCSDDDCSGHGTCEDATGTAVCTCTTAGHEGERCESCASGYQDHDENGVCAPACGASSCNDHGTCDDASGTAICSCVGGYEGPDCEACSAGTADPDGDGVCTEACTSESCGANTLCDDTTGVVVCSCESGTSDADGDGNCSAECAVYGGTASAGPGTPYRDPWFAFDGNPSSDSTLLDASVYYLEYDYGSGVAPTIVSYTIYAYGYSASATFGYTVVASNDGSTWTTLSTSSYVLPLNIAPKRVTFENTTGYRYYRLNLYAPEGWIAVTEFQLNSCE